MTHAEPADGPWHKSRASDVNGNCVEVALGQDSVRVRNSRHPSAAVLTFSHAEWRAFLIGARGGEFDLPTGIPVDPAAGEPAAGPVQEGPVVTPEEATNEAPGQAPR